jgi:hypothetical protein
VTVFPGDAGSDDDPLHDPQAVEAAFEEIVAGMDPLAPTAEDSDSEDGGADGGEHGRGDGVPPGAAAIPPMLPPRTPRSDWEGWDDVRRDPEGDDDDEAAIDAAFDAIETGEDEGHYEPPPPPPIPKGDPVTRWAWAGAVGAPVLALVLLLLGQNLDGLLGLILVAACLGGFITLLSRLRPHPRMDDGPDDGAVV